MVCVIYVAARTSQIKQKNFKDTKKVNFFMFLVFLTSFGYTVVTVLLYISDSRATNLDNNSGKSTLGAHVSQILGYLTLPFLCITLLFVPKLVPLISPSKVQKHKITITKHHYKFNRKISQISELFLV